MKCKSYCKKVFLATVLILSIGYSSFAHDFEVDGIYYSYVNKVSKTVKVSYQGSSYNSFDNEYSGTVTIPQIVQYSGVSYSVVAIGKEAFRDCSEVTSVTIPNSVTEVGLNAFYNTKWYKSQSDGLLYMGDCCLGFKGANPTGAISIKGGTRIIANSAFAVCSGLTDVAIPNTIAHIGEEAFYGCRKLTKFPMPASVTTIGANAFQECSGLTDIIFPNSVTSIGAYALYGCSSLRSIQSLNPTPPTCIENSLYNCYNIPLIVADGASERYATALEWSKFTNIQEAGIEEVQTDENATEVSRYDINGRLLTEPTIGVNIVKMSDGSTKKVIVSK